MRVPRVVVEAAIHGAQQYDRIWSKRVSRLVVNRADYEIAELSRGQGLEGQYQAAYSRIWRAAAVFWQIKGVSNGNIGQDGAARVQKNASRRHAERAWPLETQWQGHAVIWRYYNNPAATY